MTALPAIRDEHELGSRSPASCLVLPELRTPLCLRRSKDLRHPHDYPASPLKKRISGSLGRQQPVSLARKTSLSGGRGEPYGAPAP